MEISFVLPNIPVMPMGGFKIVYEYANRLTKRGHSVNLIHPKNLSNTTNPLRKLSRKLNYLYLKLRKKNYPDSWFKIDENVSNYFVPYLKNNYLPDADIIFATAWNTSRPVLKLDKSKGLKCYFIQSLETWAGHEKEVTDSWKFPMCKIVIANWLKEYAESIKENCTYIPNGLDFDKFGIDCEIVNRNSKHLLMMYHFLDVKGSIFGLEAIRILKRTFEDLEVTIFGIVPRPKSLPDWVTYYYRPTQLELRELYNRASIFVSPSLVEGFPLPPAEAMVCGCAIVATDIGGHREYCINNNTAILVEPRSPKVIFNACKMLIENDEIKNDIATKGSQFIRKFTWDKSVSLMEETLKSFKNNVN